MEKNSVKLVITVAPTWLSEFESLAAQKFMKPAAYARLVLVEHLAQNKLPVTREATYKQTPMDKKLAAEAAQLGEIDISVPLGKEFDAQLPWLKP